jgi:hypothetical protein
LIFVHLVKVISVTKPELRVKRHGEIARFHSEMTTRFTNAMRQDIDVQGLWQSALPGSQVRSAQLRTGHHHSA